MSLDRSRDRELQRLRSRVQALEQREREYSSPAVIFTLLFAPFGLLVVVVGALLSWAASGFERWLERRSAAQYHRRRQARRAPENS